MEYNARHSKRLSGQYCGLNILIVKLIIIGCVARQLRKDEKNIQKHDKNVKHKDDSQYKCLSNSSISKAVGIGVVQNIGDAK